MDEINQDGDCSLREAIQAANTDAAVDARLAGAGATIQAGTEDTFGIDRVLHVLTTSDLAVHHAHIRYGLAGNGAAPHIKRPLLASV